MCAISRRSARFAAGLLLGGAIVPTVAMAQESDASLRGRLSVGEATAQQVTAVDVERGTRRAVAVRSDGRYDFAALRPGRYRLEIETTNGVRRTDEFTLRVGQDAQLDFDFAKPEFAESDVDEIVIVGQRLQTLSTGEIGATITTEQIEQLPQINRNFLAFADLAPGVILQRDAGGQTRLQGGAQGANAVNVFIDGVGQKDYVLRGGITGQDTSQGNPFPQSAIGEYRVITQNYKAEFDQVSSAAITAVTRSGTNAFEGGAFYDYTSDALRAKTPNEEEGDLDKVETVEKQFGGSLAGPIIQDKLFYFATYEGKRIESPVEITPGGGFTVDTLPPEYAALVVPGSRTFNENLYFGKLDWTPSASDLIQASLKVREETGVDWNGGTATADFRSNINTDEIRGLFRYERTNENWTNDLRITYEDSTWNPSPISFGPITRLQIPVDNDVLIVGPTPSIQEKGQKGWSVQDDFTITGLADHTIKFGVKIKQVELNSLQQNAVNPTYRYNVLFDYDGDGDDEFNDTVPYRVDIGNPVEALGNGAVSTDNFQLGLFVQDDWQITDRLELALGIRWDYEETPSYLDFVTPADAVEVLRAWSNLDNANYDIEDYISTGEERDAFTGAFQPRLGFNYELTDAIVLFGGYGRSYDRNQYDFLQTEQTTGTFITSTFFFDTGDPEIDCSGGCVPYDPVFLTEAGRQQLLESVPEGGNREIYLIDNDLKVPYSDQFSLGARRPFGNWDVEVGYSYVTSKDGFVRLLGNRREDGSFYAEGAIFGAPFGFNPPGGILTNIILNTNGIETKAHSAYLKVGKTYDEASGWGLNATYTYTDAEENRAFGETFSFDFPSPDALTFNPSLGVSDHNLVATGSYDLPWDVNLSGKFTYRSEPFVGGFGAPGLDFTQWFYRTTRADDDFSQLDLALTKFQTVPNPIITNARLRLRLDVINVLNTRNYTGFEGFGGSENFGDRINFNTGGNLPRTIKVSAGIDW